MFGLSGILGVGQIKSASWPQIAHRIGEWALVIAFVMAATAIVEYPALAPGGEAVEVVEGQPAPRDVRAPETRTYYSEVLYREAQERAAEAVPDQYDFDENVARRQTALARRIIEYIGMVRSDPYATEEQRRADIAAIAELHRLEEENLIPSLIRLSDAQWNEVAAEIEAELENVMGGEVYDDRLDEVYDRVRHRVEAKADLTEAQVEIVIAVVLDLIRPNRIYNAESTERAREAARERIRLEDFPREIVAGTLLVEEGKTVGPIDIEELELYDLRRTPDTRTQKLAGAFLLVALCTASFGLYFNRAHPGQGSSLRTLAFIGGAFLVYLAAARMMIPAGYMLKYLYPAASMAILMAALFDTNTTILLVLLLSITVGLMAAPEAALELVALSAVGGIVGALTLRRRGRINDIFLAGLAAGVAGMIVVLAFGLVSGNDLLSIAPQVGLALLNGLFSAGLALVGLFLTGTFLDITTSIQLMELMRPDHPLLQRLLREAPGTYQHSLQVANLAENAAQRIGADAMLTRTGALYHDVGKILNPHFFVENQADGVNPHDNLDPATSARIIISHVTEGEKLARKYHLPAAIRAFIPEHHGTNRVTYFYRKAVEAAGGDESKVDPTQFTYPGPPPQSRETALLMLADASESAVRARRPSNEDEIEEVVDSIINSIIQRGQLDHSGLTLNDIKAVREVFVNTLKGVFHPRIAYPPRPQPKAEKPKPTTRPQMQPPPPSEPSQRPAQVQKAPQQRSAQQPTAHPPATPGSARRPHKQPPATPARQAPQQPRTSAPQPGTQQANRSDSKGTSQQAATANGTRPSEQGDAAGHSPHDHPAGSQTPDERA